jgi:hypothetical protein
MTVFSIFYFKYWADQPENQAYFIISGFNPTSIIVSLANAVVIGVRLTMMPVDDGCGGLLW